MTQLLSLDLIKGAYHPGPSLARGRSLIDLVSSLCSVFDDSACQGRRWMIHSELSIRNKHLGSSRWNGIGVIETLVQDVHGS